MTDRDEVERLAKRNQNAGAGGSIVPNPKLCRESAVMLRALAAENEALRQRAEAAEAQIAAAWEAGRDAAANEGGYACGCKDSIEALAPPADASAALNARLDAEWNAVIEAAGNLESVDGYANCVPRHRIRALRR